MKGAENTASVTERSCLDREVPGKFHNETSTFDERQQVIRGKRFNHHHILIVVIAGVTESFIMIRDCPVIFLYCTMKRVSPAFLRYA